MPRKLRSDEKELWNKVRDTTNPLHPIRKSAEDGPTTAKTKPQKRPAMPVIQHFRVGAKASASAAKQKKPAPIQMDAKTFGKMTRGKMVPQARIDLHGMTMAQAQPALMRFILTSAQRQLRLVLVITGKGKSKPDFGPIPERVGVLKHNVPHWLAQPPISQVILDVAPAHQKHGGAGAFYVYLRRNP